MQLDDMKALELEPGKVYAIELEYALPAHRRDAVALEINRMADRIGCKFVVLEKGVRIARQADE